MTRYKFINENIIYDNDNEKFIPVNAEDNKDWLEFVEWSKTNDADGPDKFENWETVGRAIRDSLLKETDWTQFPDSPLTDKQKEAYKKYRQELRNLPKKYPDYDDVVWPKEPKV